MSEGTDAEKLKGGSAPRTAGIRASGARRARSVLISVFIVVILGVLLFASPLLSQHNVIKVGVIVPLSGPASYLVDVRDGLELAAERLNRWGGINGAEIELLVRDSESDPAKAVEAFEELEREEKPLFYVSAMSHLTMPLVPLAEENEVVLVGVAASAQELINGTRWTVRYYSDAVDEAVATMHTLQVLGVSTLGILHGSDEFSLSVESLLGPRFAATGGSLESVLIAADDDDYSNEISQLADMEAIFVVTTISSLDDVIICLDDCGYGGHILTSSGGSSPYVTTMPEAEGIYVAAPAMYNVNYMPVKWLKEEFEARFGRSLTHFVSCGYDILNLFHGLMRGMELTRTSVRLALEGGFVFSGTIGPLNVLPDSHDIGFDLLSARVSEGRLWYL